MLSLPEEWDYTLKGLSQINREGIDAIREAVGVAVPVVKGVERIGMEWLFNKSLFCKSLLDSSLFTCRIAGDDYPAELVKSKFMKLNSSHIQFVIDCMHQNTTKIRNIKKYLLFWSPPYLCLLSRTCNPSSTSVLIPTKYHFWCRFISMRVARHCSPSKTSKHCPQCNPRDCFPHV